MNFIETSWEGIGAEEVTNLKRKNEDPDGWLERF
jgi:hypothetical protein